MYEITGPTIKVPTPPKGYSPPEIGLAKPGDLVLRWIDEGGPVCMGVWDRALTASGAPLMISRCLDRQEPEEAPAEVYETPVTVCVEVRER